MPKRTNEFQKIVFLLKRHAAAGATVTESKLLRDRITGTWREVDICVESIIAGHHMVVSVECRDRGRRSDVQWVEEMKTKHERLPTNALVLISSSGFTKEAETVAQAYGIETIPFGALDDNSAERLFGDSSSLWSKVFTLTASKVVSGVSATATLPAERVALNPDNLIYNHKGEEIGSAKELVELLLHAEHVFLEFGRLGGEFHKSFQIRWEPARDKDGNHFCLQKLDPFVLRPIEFVEITGPCSFQISEFPLQHGVLGDVRVAWGSGTFLGREALLVASEGEGVKRTISITNEGIVPKNPTKPSTRTQSKRRT